MPLGHQRCCHGVQNWSTGRGAVASMHIMLAVFSRSLFLNAERRVLVFFGVWGWSCVCLTLLCDRNRSWWLLEVSNRSGHSWRLAMSFRVASIALHDILTCFIMCWCRSVWAAQYFCEVFRRWLAFFVAGAALWTCPFSFSVPSAALSTCGVACFFANRIVCVKWWRCAHYMWDIVRVVFCVAGASFGEDPSCVECRSIWDTLDFTVDTPHSTLYTLHFTLYTWHSALYTPHSTLFTFHSTFYAPHSTLYTLHFTLYTWHSALYTPHSTLFTFHSTFYTPHSTLYTLHVTTLHTLHSTLYTVHSTSTCHTAYSTLYTFHFTLHTRHPTLYTVHFTLHTLHFTLCTLHSALCTVHSTLSTWHSTLFTLHVTLHTTHCIPQSTLHTLHCLHIPHFALHPIPQSTMVR